MELLLQVAPEGCMRLPANYFPEGVLNPIPRNTHSFGGFPSLSDKGSSGLMGLNALRNASGLPATWWPRGTLHSCPQLTPFVCLPAARSRGVGRHALRSPLGASIPCIVLPPHFPSST